MLACASLLVGGAAIAQSPVRAQPLNWSAAEIEFLARTPFSEGIPPDLVLSFPPAVAAPVLRQMLANPAEAQNWPNVAGMLGMIGSREDARTLYDFAQAPLPDNVDPHLKARARSSAILGLGYLANRTRSPEALAFLSKGVDPDSWPRDTGDIFKPEQAAKTSMLALGLAGTQDALRSIDGARSLPLFQSQSGAATLDEAIKTFRIVYSRGLLGYYGKEHKPTLKTLQPGNLSALNVTPSTEKAN